MNSMNTTKNQTKYQNVLEKMRFQGSTTTLDNVM